MTRSRAAIGTAIATSALTSLALLAVAPAAHAKPTISDPIASGLVGPLQMDVDASKAIPRIAVAESFAGNLTLVKGDGSKKVLHHEDAEVAGVDIEGKKIAFLTTGGDENGPNAFLKVLTMQQGEDKVRTVANLLEFEVENNPDAGNSYGFQDLSQECEDTLPPNDGEQPPVREYDGIVESHPYGLSEAPGGGWYVADAAANAILKVAPGGAVTTVAVLKPQPVVVTAEMAEASGFDECVVGETFNFEPVPTDVEVDRDGRLIVSQLPGGPEDPSFGARGSVVQINPANGKVKHLAGGFAGATNVAVKGATIFVSQLFGGEITKITQDVETKKFVSAPFPAGIEWSKGQLYALTDVFPPEEGAPDGKLVVITP